MTRTEGPDLRARVATAVAGFPRQRVPAEGRRAAAVAIVLGEDPEGRPSFLLTRRAARMRAHAGQWALPGGRSEPGEDAVATARRELAKIFNKIKKEISKKMKKNLKIKKKKIE